MIVSGCDCCCDCFYYFCYFFAIVIITSKNNNNNNNNNNIKGNLQLQIKELRGKLETTINDQTDMEVVVIVV